MSRVHQPRRNRRALAISRGTVLMLMIPFMLMIGSPQTSVAQVGYDDHQNMMEQLGLKRFGRDPIQTTSPRLMKRKQTLIRTRCRTYYG